MPICNKIPFRRRKPDSSIKDDDRVWYHDLTQEVFTTYDDFFDRYIKCNSVCWTCSLTGKSNLTFEDALRSEKKATDEIKASFPKQLAQPLLWYSQHCYRGKLDDLLNDIYCVSRDRYFNGELVWYQKTDTVRHKGTIQAVEYDPTKGLKISPKKKEKRVSDDEEDTPKKKGDKVKPEEPEMPPPEAYTYTFLILGENEDNENATFTDIPHTKISRPKAVGSRVKLKHYFKHLMTLKGDKIVVKPKVIQEFELNKLNLTDFFAGPLPKFAHVPRKRLFGPTSEVKIPSTSVKRKLESSADIPQKKKRLSKAEKIQKEILEQQEVLQEVFEQAETFEVEDLSKWRQTDRLLTEKEIEALKNAIKEAREDYREREKDRKKKERDEQMAQKKPRDDLQCDDLRPLPELKPVELPEFISDEMFGEMLTLLQFFNTFQDLLDNEDMEITFQDCVEAVLSKKPGDNGLVKVLTAFLKIRAFCVDKEDGDEANPEAPSEVSNETYAIFSNKTYGRTVISLNKLYEKIRFIFAANPPTLPINWISISEVLRLNLITSGYCSIGTVYARRATERGGIDCYEDPVFIHLSSDSHIPEKLETVSIFSLTSEERLTLFEILREQMLTFATLRNPQEERLLFVPDAKRQLKQLKLWDIEQEKIAKVAGYTSEDNDKKNTKDKKVIMLKNYLKAVNEGKRKIPDLEEIKEIMLTGIPYDDFDAEDIRELREIQKTFINEKIEKLNRDIFEGFCKIGLPFLGRDRAFRLYYYFNALKVFLVENVMDPGECDEPTPIKDVETKDLTTARIEVTGCTGDKTNCPIHNTNRPRWLYLAEKDGIDLLLDAMNPRGFREIDLAETLSSFKPFIGPIVEDLADQMIRFATQEKENDEKQMKIEEMEKEEIVEDSPIPIENGLPKLSPEQESSLTPEVDDETASNTSSTRVTRSSSRCNITKIGKIKKQKLKPSVKNIVNFLGLDDFKMEEFSDENELKEIMKTKLLEMEENIHMKAIGEMLFNQNQTREDFRKAVLDGADIKPFLVKDVDYFVHCAEEVELLTDEQLEEFTTEIHKLILTFVKIIHSVRMKFLEESPFMMIPKKSKTNEIVIAPTFIEWQKQLLECKSVSSLAVFYEIFNERISWNFTKTGKCCMCRKKAIIEESVICEICSAMYHLTCAPGKVTSRVYYICSKTCEKKAAKAIEKKNLKIAEIVLKSAIKVEKDKSIEETKPILNGEEMDEDFDADNNSSVENHNDELKLRRRRNATKKPVDYSELENGGKSDSEEPKTRRSNRTRTKKEPGFEDEANFRAISMGLRNGTKIEIDLKKQLMECQKIIENAMKQPFGYPFSYPVNEKEAPGYSETIKKPMDLRTMINKFKNLDYESSAQVWKDCKLIVDNCKTYNYEDDEINGDANKLDEYLKKELRNIIGDIVDAE